MKVLIIEDEIPAQQILLRLLGRYFPDFTIMGILDSVDTAVNFLRHQTPDLIFMDVELSDGRSFEIFRQVDITCPVIVTTAYTDYALDAFRNKCIDYLMKPIEDGAFRESVDRCMQLCGVTAAPKTAPDVTAYVKPVHKHHFTIKLGSQILVIDVNDIAYFYSNEKSTWLVTRDGKQYMTDDSLTAIENEVDPARFYKISRKCLVGLSSIYTISKYFNHPLPEEHRAGDRPPRPRPILHGMARGSVVRSCYWTTGMRTMNSESVFSAVTLRLKSISY